MPISKSAIEAAQKAFHELDEGGCSIEQCWEAALQAGLDETAKQAEQPVECAGFLADLHRKDFTLEKALDFLRAHNDGVYKITASKHLDELVEWLLAYLQRPSEREAVTLIEEAIRELRADEYGDCHDKVIALLERAL